MVGIFSQRYYYACSLPFHSGAQRRYRGGDLQPRLLLRHLAEVRCTTRAFQLAPEDARGQLLPATTRACRVDLLTLPRYPQSLLPARRPQHPAEPQQPHQSQVCRRIPHTRNGRIEIRIYSVFFFRYPVYVNLDSISPFQARSSSPSLLVDIGRPW